MGLPLPKERGQASICRELTDPRHTTHSSSNGPCQQRHAGHCCVGGFVAVAVAVVPVVGHGVYGGESRQRDARHIVQSRSRTISSAEID